MSLRLFLVRHAATDWNRQRRYQGWRDIPLSEEGRAQAAAAGRLLAGSRLDAVWSSPLRRARDTATAIAAPHGLEVHTDEAFKEIRLGPWEGFTVDEVRARFPGPSREWAEAPHVATWTDAERLVDVRARVLAGLDALRGRHSGETVCLVAHGVTCRILVLEALGLGLDRLWSLQLSSTGISELEFRDDWTAVHRMNTLVHLDQIPVGRP